MKTPQERKEIKQMHRAKLKSYSSRDIGMAVGAAVNKAVDVAIAVYNKEEDILTDGQLEDIIRSWTNKIYAISQRKKIEIEEQPTQKDMEDKMAEDARQEKSEEDFNQRSDEIYQENL